MKVAINKFEASHQLKCVNTYPVGENQHKNRSLGVFFAEKFLDPAVDKEMDEAFRLWIEYKTSK